MSSAPFRRWRRSALLLALSVSLACHPEEPATSSVEAAPSARPAEPGAAIAASTSTSSDATDPSARVDAPAAASSIATTGSTRVTILDRHLRTPVERARVFVLDPETLARVLPAGHPQRLFAADAWFEEQARAFTADDLGRLSIDGLVAGSWISARTAERFGWTSISREQPRLELAIERPLVLRTLSPGQLPVAGVPVSIRAIEGALASRTIWSALTEGSQARAALAEVHDTLSTAAANAQLLACLEIPSLETLARRVDPADLPDEPLDLALPATGEVRLACAGDAWPADVVLELALVPQREEAADTAPRVWFQPPRRESARASWPFVGLRGDVVVRARGTGRETIERRRSGPIAAGEVVELALGVPRPFVVVTGRALGENGAPLASTRLLWARGEELGELTTDEHAHFRIDLGPRDGDGGGAELVLALPSSAGSPVRQAKLTLNESRDLGDVTLDVAPVLAAGRVTLAGGGAPAGAIVVLERLPGSASKAPDALVDLERRAEWTRVPLASALVGDDGRFELRGLATEDRTRVALVGSGCEAPSSGAAWPSAVSEPFTGTRTDLALALAPSAYVRIAPRVPAGIDPRDLVAEIVDTARGKPNALSRERFCGGDALVSPPLTPGKKTLRIWWQRKDAWSREVELSAGQTLDLGELELRDLGHHLRFTFVASDGTPVEQGRVYAIARDAPRVLGGRWLTDAPLEHAASALTVTELPVDLWIFADGLRARMIEGVRTSAHIELAPAPRVTVTLDPALEPLPPGFSLELDLVHESRWAGAILVRRTPVTVDDQVREDWYGRRSKLQRGVAFDPPNPLIFRPAQAGAHHASWALVERTDEGARLHPLEPREPTIVVPTDVDALSLVLAPTAESLKDALERVR